MTETVAHPLPLPFVSGSFQFSPAEAFAETARDFRLRAPADGTEGLLGPFRSVGYCLEPLGLSGDVRWFDPSMPAQHGDLVLVELGEEVLAGIVERQRHDPHWLATYGENPSRLACKILFALGSEWWLLTNDGAFPLEGNRILGTCRRIKRDGHNHCATELLQIAPGSATAVHNSVNPAMLTLAVTNPGEEVSERDYITFTPPINCVCEVRVNYRGQLTNTGGGSSSGIEGEGYAFVSEDSDPDGTRQLGQPISHTFDALPIGVAGIFSLTGGVLYRAGLYVRVETSTSNAEIRALQLTITVIEIRR